MTMTPAELHTARATLGQQWGLNRPLKLSELGRSLRLCGRDPGEAVHDWERGHNSISGPVSIAIEAMLSGFRPNGLDMALRPRQARQRPAV